MAEVAGLVFGAVSIAALYSTCLEGYTQILSAKSLGKDAAALLCKLEIEEARFIVWGRNAGLLDDESGTGCRIRLDNAETLRRALLQIRSLTSNADNLKRRYGLEIDKSTASSASNKNGGGERIANLLSSGETRMRMRDFMSAEPLLLDEERRQESLVARIQGRASLMKKIRWSSIDKTMLASLVDELRGLNNSLTSLLQETEQKQFRADFQALCRDSSSTNDLLKLKVLEDAAGQDYYHQMGLPTSHKILRLQLELEYTKRFESGLHQSSISSLLPNSLQKPFDKVLEIDPGAQRSLGMYNNKQILLEWRTFEDHESTESINPQILLRLENLATLLYYKTPKPVEFRVLSCCGFVVSEKPVKFGFMYDLPSPSSIAALGANSEQTPANLLQMATRIPSSLHDILVDKGVQRYRPSQSSRLLLARRLATSLLHLHSTGWLHKGIRSHNILFPSITDPEISNNRQTPRQRAFSLSKKIEHPYLTGFGYSRLSGPNQLTEQADSDPIYNQYRHPDVQGSIRQPYRRCYDAYSLGLVLVEIACWTPLIRFYSSSKTGQENIERLQRNVVESGDLAHWMGDLYAKVVEKCLKCDWGKGGGVEEMRMAGSIMSFMRM